MSELSPLSRSIVHEGRSALAPTEAERRRMRAGIAGKLAAAAVVAAPATVAAATAATAGGAAAGTATATAASSGLLALILKVTLVVGVVGGGGSAAYVALSPGEGGTSDSPPAAVTGPPGSRGERPDDSTARPTLAPPAPAVADGPLVDPARLAAPDLPDPSAPAPSPGLAAELSLLDVARQALRAGEPERALDALGRYHRKHPSGQLGHEAALLRAEALCKLGRRAEARELLQQVRERRSDLPGVDAVEATCDLQ